MRFARIAFSLKKQPFFRVSMVAHVQHCIAALQLWHSVNGPLVHVIFAFPNLLPQSLFCMLLEARYISRTCNTADFFPIFQLEKFSNHMALSQMWHKTHYRKGLA